MNANPLYIFGVALTLSLPFSANGAPYGPPPPSGPYGYRPALIEEGKQARITLSDLNNQVRNHEVEIRTFESKLQTQQETMETLHDQVKESIQSQRDLIRSNQVHLEAKLNSLEKVVQGSLSDIRQIKEQANDSVNILGQYKQKMLEIEKLIEDQNQQIINLEAALKSIVELMQAKEAAEKATAAAAKNSASTADQIKVQGDGTKIYTVQPGDSLEKIARRYNVSVKALKEVNHLTKDRIIVGQNLQIP